MTLTPYTDDDKKTWLELHADSEISAAAFCREHELPYQSFLQWKHQFSGDRDLPKFIEIETSPPKSTSSREVIVELTLAQNITLRIFQPSQS